MPGSLNPVIIQSTKRRIKGQDPAEFSVIEGADNPGRQTEGLHRDLQAIVRSHPAVDGSDQARYRDAGLILWQHPVQSPADCGQPSFDTCRSGKNAKDVMEQPILRTASLVLRPFESSDAGAVQRLAGDRAVADTALNIPYPYEDGMAEEWIEGHKDKYESRQEAIFAVVEATGGKLIGAVGLIIEADFDRAELGYWIGRPFWGCGYATEAARTVLDFAFGPLGLHRVHANHIARNPASGRVMQKIGMVREGMLRRHAKKGDAYEDLVVYGMLKNEWAGPLR